MADPRHLAVDVLLARWSGASGSELANDLFLTELIALLELP